MFDRYKGDRYIVLWQHENGDCTKGSSPPPIDLNNLFKYAVPKAIEIIEARSSFQAIHILFRKWLEKYWEIGDFELALFWALDKVRKND